MHITRIHRILETAGSLAFVGVFDTLSAKLAQQVGFPMAFVSGYSVAATDNGLLRRFCDVIYRFVGRQANRLVLVLK